MMSRLTTVEPTDFDDDDDYDFDGLDIKLRRADGTKYETAQVVLPQLLVAKSVPHNVSRRLRTGLPVSIILIVPEHSENLVAEALRNMCSDALRVLRCKTKKNDFDQLVAVRSVGSGAPLVYLTSSLANVPETVRRLCDGIHVLRDIDPDSLRLTLHRCTRGRVPKRFAPDLNKVPLPIVASAIVSGSRARLAMQTIERLAAPAKSDSVGATLPRLEDCIEYGPLREWGLGLAKDLEAWKAGTLAAADLDASILLVSPPGFGKTYFAKVLQKHLGVPLIRLGISEIMQGDGYLNTALNHMTAAFDSARRSAPAILFLDEVDTFSRRSNGTRNEQYFNSVVNHALVLLDGAGVRNDGVVLLGATNRPEAVDPALLRPGRLSRKIVVPLPNMAAREHILRTQLQGQLSGANLLSVARRLDGASPAEIMQAVKQAKAMARANGADLALPHLLAAVSPTQDLPAELLRRIAVHEAGHAACAVVLNDPNLLVASVTVERSGGGGHTSFRDSGNDLETTRSVENRVLTILAGRAAELVLLGDEKTAGAGGRDSSDLAIATRLVAASLGSLGLYERLSWRCEPESADALIERDSEFRRTVEEKLQNLMAKAINLVERHRGCIDILAKHLAEHKVADGATVMKVINRARKNSPARARRQVAKGAMK